MSDQLSQAIIGSLGALVGAVLVWMRDRRRDVSADRVASSSDNRAWAEMFRSELDAERRARRELEAEVNTLRSQLVEERQRCADLARRVAGLERVIRELGGRAPDDAPDAPAPEEGTS